MVKRIPLNNLRNRSGSGTGVGYRKPPTHSQFKPGESGNPKGRPKGRRNFRSELLDKLQTPVKITQNGRVKKVSTLRAGLEVLAAKMMQGDPRALDQMIRLAEKHSQPAVDVDEPLDPDDEAILDAYFERQLKAE